MSAILLLVGGPRGAIAAVIALLAVLAWGGQTWKLSSERASHTETRLELATTQNARDQAVAINKSLIIRVEAQNQAVAALETDKKRRDAQSNAAANATLTKPAPIPSGSGPVIMTEFMGGVFGR